MWLTVSTAFTTVPADTAKKDKMENAAKSADASGPEEEDSSSTNNSTTEEKVPSSTSFSEEYLHNHHQTHYFFTIVSTFHKCENDGTYIAFHGELLVPPPNRA